MIRLLLTIGSLLTIAIEVTHSRGLDIYPYVVESLLQLEAEKQAERAGERPIIQAATSVCYDELGCFDRNGTFKHLKQLPDTPENIATQFLLYTKKNRNNDQVQLIDYRKPKSIAKSNIDPKRSLKIITHGFGGKTHGEWMWDMKNAFIDQEEANVIIVDWSNGAAVPHYINSAVNAELVGAQITALYYIIKDKFGIKEQDLHVIGFSLGAQVMGFVGKRMKKMRGTRPGHITGLDPAGPLYEDYGKDVHLFKDDGDKVDIIHTNADLLIYGGVGIRIPIGHVDYYPNGGVRQPGCNTTIRGFFQDLFTKGKERQRVCNHERAVHLYLETILDPPSCHFLSYKCSNFSEFQAGKCFDCIGDDCGIMGYRNKGAGTHYLQTHDSAPFCAESVVLSVRFAEENKKSYGAILFTVMGESGAEQNISITREKDERLVPGDSRVFTAILSPKIKIIKEVRVLYMKYNGWFAKGTPTFTLGSVSILNVKGKPIFSNCQDHELTDEIPLHLQSTGETCKVS